MFQQVRTLCLAYFGHKCIKNMVELIQGFAPNSDRNTAIHSPSVIYGLFSDVAGRQVLSDNVNDFGQSVQWDRVKYQGNSLVQPPDRAIGGGRCRLRLI